MDKKIDCVIVGYNDVDLGEQIDSHYKMREYSGGYQNILTNTLQLDGKRHTYMSILNQVLRSSGNGAYTVAGDLHVAKIPSLGVLYLYNFLLKNDYSSALVNSFTHEKNKLADYLSADVKTVAITTTFYLDSKPVQEIVQFVRARNPTVKIIVGGPFIFNTHEAYSNDPMTLSSVLSAVGADIYVVDSQGELTLSRVVSHFRGDSRANETRSNVVQGKLKSNSLDVIGVSGEVSTERLSEIPNIMYFDDSQLMITRREVESNDMNDFSIDYSNIPAKHFSPLATTRTARSCAFTCSFCRYPIMAGPLNLVDIDVMEDQFNLFEKQGVKYVVIIDDTFNVPLPRFKELCQMMIKNNYSFQWFSYFRASNADDECFDLMSNSRCAGVFLGIESGDQQILNNMNKTAKVYRYTKAIKELRARNIITFASIIVGFPGETNQSVQNTIDFIQEAKPSYWRAELYYHMHKTPISERSEEFGIKGAGYSWEHNTMDWREASEHVARMYRTVTESKILPLYMFDFWCIPYLLSCGLTKDQINQFVTVLHKLMVREIKIKRVDCKAHIPELSRIFS